MPEKNKVQKLESWQLVSIALRISEADAKQRIELFDDQAMKELKEKADPSKNAGWPQTVRDLCAKLIERQMKKAKRDQKKQASNQATRTNPDPTLNSDDPAAENGEVE